MDYAMIWWVLAIPLFGSLIQALMGKLVVDALGPKTGKAVMGTVAAGIIFAAFGLALQLTLKLYAEPEAARVQIHTLIDWIKFQSISLPFEARIDALSMTMALVITGIGGLIHVFAAGYMAEDKEFTRFFTYLNLFVAFMLMLVLGNNLALLFIGWEGVGACSYLLIGFWHKDIANAKAANKAFIVNRVGDWGLTLGMFWLVVLVAGNAKELGLTDNRFLSYDVILPAAESLYASYPVQTTIISMLIFVGAMGKSAQFPLYFWLPDAMAGPTPVSALIHAATMVTAGVVLLNRLSPIVVQSATAMSVIAIVGAITALFAALIAMGQTDIKKVLAYSTVSQLGYMFIACGVGAFWAGMFHVVTHAFFKALLFLGSGSVIHAMSHDQDMRNYGNLKGKLPITFLQMMIAFFAIAGVPFLFAGFWSKEAILGSAIEDHYTLAIFGDMSWGKIAGYIGFLVAGMTAFYMTRMMMLTFFGPKQRWKEARDHGDHHHHETPALAGHVPSEDPHSFFYSEDEAAANAPEEEHHHDLEPSHEPKEVPAVMWLPLVPLAIGSLGLIGAVFEGYLLAPKHFFAYWLESANVYVPHTEHEIPKIVLIIVSTLIAAAGIGLGVAMYRKGLPEREGWDMSKWNPFQRSALNQFGYDHVMADKSTQAGGVLGSIMWWIDKNIVDGLVRGTGGLAKFFGGMFRQVQSGRVRGYAVLMTLGVVGLIVWLAYSLGMGGQG